VTFGFRKVRIIADFRTQTSLREGANTILHHDCILLAQVRPHAVDMMSNKTE